MKSIAVNAEQLQKIKTGPGFVAALDQSGGSTPKALRLYGISENAWSSDKEMFTIVHQMRTRIITSPAFNGERIIGAILFENTMDREIEGQPTSEYLWNVKRVVPFLKVDQGLAAEQNGVQLMKPMPTLPAILEKLNELPVGQFLMLKLTLPEQEDFYTDFIKHPRVLRVVALSGGYSREEANNRLRKQHGVIASFSRALVEGLAAQQSDAEFNATLDKSIQSIFEASNS